MSPTAESTEHTELVSLAANFTKIISDVKTSFWRVLVGASAAFAFIMTQPTTLGLQLTFLFGLCIAFYLCSTTYPNQLEYRRGTIRRAYERFSGVFKDTHGRTGDTHTIGREERCLNGLALLYLLVLGITFLDSDKSSTFWKLMGF